MKLLLALALVTLVHGCLKTPEGPDLEGPNYGKSDGEIWDGIRASMKRPPRLDERQWDVAKEKIERWDYDALRKKYKMGAHDTFQQLKDIREGKNAMSFAFHDNIENPYWKYFSYVNPRTQMLDGFLPKIMQKACDFCNQTCGMVNLGTDVDRCFDEEELTGSGLSRNEFTACVGVGATARRANVFNFSVGVSMSPARQLWIRMNTSDINSDEDVNGKKIGIPGPMHQYGEFNVDCLKYHWPDVMPSEVIAKSKNETELVMQLIKGEVDVIMGPAIDTKDPANSELLLAIKPLEDPFYCVKDGVYQLMHRKDRDMRMFGMCYWYGVVRSGEYKRMCEEYGGFVEQHCIDFEAWMDKMGYYPKPYDSENRGKLF